MTEATKDGKMPPYVSPEFEGRTDDIRVSRIESDKIPGGQVVVIYFNSIGGRGKPEVFEWSGQEAGKMDEYEAKLLALIKEEFGDYPVVIASVPPHAGTLYAFGNPNAQQSEVNPYKLATLHVSDMSAKQESADMPALIGCPQDLEVLAAETRLWLKANTLEDYANASRDSNKIRAEMNKPNKVSGMFQVE